MILNHSPSSVLLAISSSSSMLVFWPFYLSSLTFLPPPSISASLWFSPCVFLLLSLFFHLSPFIFPCCFIFLSLSLPSPNFLQYHVWLFVHKKKNHTSSCIFTSYIYYQCALHSLSLSLFHTDTHRHTNSCYEFMFTFFSCSCSKLVVLYPWRF